MPTVLKSGSLNLLNPQGLSRLVMGLFYLFFIFLLLVITFRQAICNHIPETNHVSKVHTQHYSYSVLTMYGTRNATSHDKRFAFLHYYFSKYVHSAQCSFLCCYYLLSPLCKALTITPRTNHVSTVHSFTAVRCLQFMTHVMLFPMISHDKCSLFV